MRFSILLPVLVLIGLLALVSLSAFAQAALQADKNAPQRCFTSDGLPDHAAGPFPGAVAAPVMQAQNISFCVPMQPRKGSLAQAVRVTGIARNGVLIRPYSAGEPPQGPTPDLHLDAQNGHVGAHGDYHYHRLPPALATPQSPRLIGWAADGFPILYGGASARSGYVLLSDQPTDRNNGRTDADKGQYWVYEEDAGNLDVCNGAMTGTGYAYFVTNRYPYFPRCLFGTEITHLP